MKIRKTPLSKRSVYTYTYYDGDGKECKVTLRPGENGVTEMDIKDTLVLLHKNPNDKKAQADRRKLEKFFRSSWFDILTQLDGEALLQKLQQTVREGVA